MDTAETVAIRAEMEEINRFLASHRLELDGGRQAAFRLTRRFMLRSPTEPHTFALHGRLYGGFWKTLAKERRAGLRIDGEPIADLDYVSMFPGLAYALVETLPPEGDLYAVSGLEDHRGAVKIGFSALLSGSNEMRRLPASLKGKLPQGWTAATFKTAIAKKHAALVPLFGRDIGLGLMFTESLILLAALRILRNADIAALPMHDGMMVAKSYSEKTEAAMREGAKAIIGRVLPVAVK